MRWFYIKSYRNPNMKYILRKDLVLPVLVMILTIPLFYSILRPGFFPMQDDLQAFRVHQMVKCLEDLQIPCRWVPDMGYQYGYPQFNYYPPSIFYLGGLLNILGIQIIDSVKILFILGFILSAFTMFIFLKAFFENNWPAFFGAILYSYVPYKAVEVYVRGSLSEFWSFVFFPVIFWASFQLIRKGLLKYMIWLAFSIGALLTTHNLMSFIFLPLFVVWAILLTLLEKKWMGFPKIVLGSLLGFGLAAFFTLPVIFEGKYVHLETLTGGYFDYRQHFVSLKQLFLSNYWEYGSSVFGSGDTVNLSTGPIQWIAALFGVILAIVNFKNTKKISTLIFFLASLELVVLFLIHQKSFFIWENINVLAWLQFPWRFLSLSIFLLSILSAATIFFLCKYKKELGWSLGIVAIVGVVILHLNFFKPLGWLGISDKDKFSGPFWEKQLTISIFDYLPVYAKLPPDREAPQIPEVLDGTLSVITYNKGSNYQTGTVEVTQEATIRLPLYDFPGMEVTIDQTKVEHFHNDCRNQKFCLGLITFKVPTGQHTIKAKLTNTPVRSIGNIITAISTLLVISLFLVSKKYGKNIA